MYLFQGDYIRYPALYELSSKYGVAGNDQVPLPARLDVLREHIRREIRKVCRVSLIPRRLQLLRSCLFLRLCTHGSTVSTLRLLRYLETLSCSPSLSSDNQPNASLFFFFFLVYFDAEKLISPIAAVTSLASFCLKQYTSYDRRGYLLQ